ncbi:PAS domain S-box-containing protein/diguanylate cyclase (GGDEF)-like protein [Kineococcus xinjiangensis]|uniref:PAS domain S-box-containing protein/diguanylate cyclase (GGDEF)-like protein n=1 Tax=Kineococcus xinjiangensis TaxID=512762 RepID=A0A2S6IK42_9ACTN|nr:EAL domain-containing protein [Kineococcus xinjiangensis]PPK94545.1 PAS domain S-box-containing protein/diguanylate cyclase (GGDEF)-like protein [Kineococcus xinjiangensis]
MTDGAGIGRRVREHLARTRARLSARARARPKGPAARDARPDTFSTAILEAVNVGVLACDADGRIVLRNAAQRRMSGVSGGDLLEHDHVWTRLRIVSAEGAEMEVTSSPLLRALDGEELQDVSLRFGPAGCADHELRDVLVTARRITAEDGTLLGAVAAVTDVTSERRAQRELQASVAFHDAVLAATPDLIYLVDPATNAILWISRNVFEGYGYTAEQLRDMGSDIVAAIAHPDDIETLTRANRQIREVADGEVVRIRFRVKDAGGEYRWLSRQVTPFARDASGAVTQILGIAQDITEAVTAEERILAASLHDDLTGLPNRRLLLDRLTSALSRAARNGAHVAILYCDLDGFKRVNDTSGHRGGDTVLIATAERLRATLRPEDTIARLSGDEFVVVLEPSPQRTPDQARIDALRAADRIQGAVREPVAVDGVQHYVTVSIGITFADAAADPAEALRDADRAMYRAKSRGKNTSAVYDDTFTATIARRAHIEGTLRAALTRRAGALRGAARPTGVTVPAGAGGDPSALTVVYQPILDLTSTRVVGVEALARLHDDAGEAIGPDQFIPLAEEVGLIAELGRHVLQTACQDLADLHAVTPAWRHLSVSVNLSARQAARSDLVHDLTTALTRSGLAPHLLTLELTETALLDAGPATMAALHTIRAHGIKIDIDDFGTGYASLRYLAELPVTGVKVDRSFTAGLPHDRISASIVTAVTGLARDLHIDCVVEGIETEEQLQALPPGVNGQGFLLARPMPPAQLARFLQHHHARQ